MTFALTALVTILKDFESGYGKIVWLTWIFHAWNFIAYAFDRDMWPWVWVELKGKSGSRRERTFMLWGTAVLYLSFLSVMAFSD